MKHSIFYFKKSISKEFKSFYNDNGYLVLRDVFEKSEAKKLDKSISKFADKEWHNIMNPDRIEFLISQSAEKFNKFKNQNDKIKFIEDAIETSNLFRSYLIDKRIEKILFGLIGKKVNGLMSHVIFKHKKSKFSKMSWVPHQDNSYAKMKNHSYVTVNLFIQKAIKENGCLYIYPKSHKFGLLKSEEYFSYHAKSSQKPGNRVLTSFNDNEKVDLIVKPGDLLIMNGNLIHGSYPNISKKLSRHLLSFNYGVVGEKFSPGYTAKRKVIHFNN